MTSLKIQLRNYRLTTAEITYRRPDHPSILQQYVWQELDLPPEYPVLHKFLDFWKKNLDGRLHSVRVACAEMITPAEVRWADYSQTLH